MEALDGPVRSDVAVLIHKIELICRRIPTARTEHAATHARQQQAAAVMEELLARKKQLRQELHAQFTGGTPSAPPSGATARAHKSARNRQLIKAYEGKLAAVDARLVSASKVWQDCVWAHTLAATALEEVLDSKRAMSGQLVGVLAGVEAAKERHLVDLWRGITLADLDWQYETPAWQA